MMGRKVNNKLAKNFFEHWTDPSCNFLGALTERCPCSQSSMLCSESYCCFAFAVIFLTVGACNSTMVNLFWHLYGMLCGIASYSQLFRNILRTAVAMYNYSWGPMMDVSGTILMFSLRTCYKLVDWHFPWKKWVLSVFLLIYASLREDLLHVVCLALLNW